MVCRPNTTTRQVPAHPLLLPQDKYAFFSLKHSYFPRVPRPPLNEHKALLDVVLYLFLSQEANRDSEHWGINLIFHLCLWICTHISPRCWFFIMCCSFCIYNDSETIASVGRPLRVFSTNGEDLAQAHSNPSQQTALVIKQDTSEQPAGTKLQILSFSTTTHINLFLEIVSQGLFSELYQSGRKK